MTLLEDYINAALKMRKVVNVELHEPGKVFNIRPQLHVILITPFGKFKTSTLDIIEHLIPKEIVKLKDYTKAGMLGTINKANIYIEGYLAKAASKVLLLDEYSEVTPDARKSLLPALHDGSIDRVLGFPSNRPITINKKYFKCKIKDGVITGKVLFTCVAATMYFPEKTSIIPEEQHKAYALLSRFSPIPVNPDIDEILGILSGRDKTPTFDVAPILYDNIVVQLDAYKKYYKLFEDEVIEYRKKFGIKRDDEGFIARGYDNMLRIDLAKCIKPNVADKNIEVTYIPKTTVFSHVFNCFRCLDMNLTELKALDLFLKFPDEHYQFFADKLNITLRHIKRVHKALIDKNFITGDIKDIEGDI